MRLEGNNKIASFSLPLIGIFFALTNSSTYAGTMGPIIADTGNIYLGVFGGGGTSTRTRISQYGTAFYLEAAGGPLAVDAFGRTNTRSEGIVGGHVGYQWGDISTAFC